MATVTIFASEGGNEVDSSSTVLATAQSGSGLALGDPSFGRLFAGQYFSSPTYNVLEAFQAFDSTGVLAETDTITSALFSHSMHTDAGAGLVEIRLYDWGASVTTADWVARANLGSQTLLASGTPDGTSVNAYFTFTDVAAIANVVKNGVTRVLVNSADHRNGVTPTVDYYGFNTSEQSGTTKDPKLVVTYTPPTTALAGKVRA